MRRGARSPSCLWSSGCSRSGRAGITGAHAGVGVAVGVAVSVSVLPARSFPSNVARNSSLTISEFEIGSLELQRLWGFSNTDQVKLRATFVVEVGACNRWGVAGHAAHIANKVSLGFVVTDKL